MHIFLAYENKTPYQETPIIPADKCVWESHYHAQSGYLMEGRYDGIKNLKVNEGPNEQDGSARHFQAMDVGSGKVKILNFRQDKLLKKDTNDVVTLTGTDSSCVGNECHFTIEPLTPPVTG